MRITLSGDLGSGKSSVGRRLAEKLRVPHFSAGSLFREIGQISNLDALTTNLAAENNVAIDHAVDDRTRELDRTVASFIIDARMAWRFVTAATKVYLSVSPRTAAERVMSDKTRSGETYDTPAAAVTALGERRQSESKRYKRLYGVDITDIANYDLFIITDDAAIEDIVDLIVACAEHEPLEKSWEQFWLPKTRIVPMIDRHASSGAVAIAVAPPPDGLPLLIADNFGFFFGDAGTLAAALGTKRPLVPYAPHAPSSRESGADVVERAKRTLKPGTLSAWEEASGIGLAFAKLLGPAPAA